MLQRLSFLYDLLNLFRNYNRKCLSNILIFFFDGCQYRFHTWKFISNLYNPEPFLLSSTLGEHFAVRQKQVAGT